MLLLLCFTLAPVEPDDDDDDREEDGECLEADLRAAVVVVAVAVLAVVGVDEVECLRVDASPDVGVSFADDERDG